MSRPLHLLLAHADDRRPILPDGLDLTATHGEAPAAHKMPTHLASPAAPAGDVDKQGWGVVIPEGPRGDQLLAAIGPLVALRRAQVGEGYRVTRVPAGLSGSEAVRWKAEQVDRPDAAAREVPLYQLILGDLHEVSPAVQQVLSDGFLTGRLAFDTLEDYAAYADKVVNWQHHPTGRQRAEVVLHTVHDGTQATRTGHLGLIAPSTEHLNREWGLGELRAGGIRHTGEPDDPRRQDLLDAARPLEAGVLFSLSHGLGPPRGGWASADHQRARQGALSFGDAGEITGADLRGERFVPGGLWVMVACFGAGTPATSAYHAWLSRLPTEVAGRAAEASLSGRPVAGGRPFIASLPKAALANPNGPLAVVAHLDLAWTYSFEARFGPATVKRHAGYTRMISAAVGDRHAAPGPFGLAFNALFEGFRRANDALTSNVQDGAIGLNAVVRDPAELGHLWMLRNDFAGYILLGDPAARLALQTGPVQERSQEQSIQDIFGGFVAPAVTRRPSREAFEQALGRYLTGAPIEGLAAELGVGVGELRQQVEAYVTAGRRATGI